MEPLASWRSGPARKRLLHDIDELVESLPPAERIATFDNDGTLWCERPAYAQAYFLIDRWREMARTDSTMRERQPWRAAVDGDDAYFADLYAHAGEIIAGVGSAFAGWTTAEFDAATREFFDTAKHPRFAVPHHRLVYQPMRELIELLVARDFAVFIVTGGGRDFVRVVAEEIYGLPRHHVIGSSAVLEWTDGELRRRAELSQPFDDGPGKPVHIFDRIGRPPALAVGNSDGDIEMLTMARSAVLLHHDDADREYAYDTGAVRALALAADQGWQIISMRDDFAQVFGFED
ncbi:phosphoserine phosphatase [Allocatelliglobosispora scoriae]|uniref:Phosphoserine phosphatase n=1 Tax=Allocatelliglobosispora scoriae TaxID=643052 RepID=A0A841BUG3_9ACTN|nr:HAD family hydrolase [Allocatelliglobosispora scoriae]MBB5871844.1 phosphoserine phosphatase [Allocatelliglobosispora scoriae]